MGTLYSTVGLAVAALILAVPRIAEPKSQRLAAYASLAVATLAYRTIVVNHQWKTGMGSRWYLF